MLSAAAFAAILPWLQVVLVGHRGGSASDTTTPECETKAKEVRSAIDAATGEQVMVVVGTAPRLKSLASIISAWRQKHPLRPRHFKNAALHMALMFITTNCGAPYLPDRHSVLEILLHVVATVAQLYRTACSALAACATHAQSTAEVRLLLSSALGPTPAVKVAALAAMQSLRVLDAVQVESEPAGEIRTVTFLNCHDEQADVAKTARALWESSPAFFTFAEKDVLQLANYSVQEHARNRATVPRALAAALQKFPGPTALPELLVERLFQVFQRTPVGDVARSGVAVALESVAGMDGALLVRVIEFLLLEALKDPNVDVRDAFLRSGRRLLLRPQNLSYAPIVTTYLQRQFQAAASASESHVTALVVFLSAAITLHPESVLRADCWMYCRVHRRRRCKTLSVIALVTLP
jgi:hypothetical protein